MITIIDYGSGNLRSVQKALQRLGAEAVITDDPQAVADADRLVLPGVGAFSDAMAAIKRRGLVEPIRRHVLADRPFLGICMGLQLLFERGDEGGGAAGLCLLAGEVTRFPTMDGFKVPHMGWNGVHWRADCRLATLFPEGMAVSGRVPRESTFYFVHAYHARPRDPDVIAGTTDYGGDFCSCVSRGRLLATQFHPEKSQHLGMRLLRYFLEEV
jgi:glutamine amidotransferase